MTQTGHTYDSTTYYRARYLDVRRGRFWGMDTQEGSSSHPTSLHKYLYASGNPVGRIDPSGNDDMAELSVSEGISEELDANIGQGVAKAGGQAKDIARALKEISDIGKSGEQAIEDALEIEKNTQRIDSISGKVNFRIPDFLEDDFLMEVKNVAYQYLSSQIRDMAYYAAANGLTFYLAIRNSTDLSGPLQDLVDQGIINLVEIP